MKTALTCKKRYLFLIFCFLIHVSGLAQQNSDRLLIEGATYRQKPLKEIIKQLEEKYSLQFYYPDDVVKQVTITAVLPAAPLDEMLQMLLKNTALDFTIREKSTIILRQKTGTKTPVKRVMPNSHTVYGYVKDSSSGEVLVGVTIYDVVSQKHTTTNQYGFYSLTVPKDSAQLFFSYAGFVPQKIVLPQARDSSLNIQLIATGMLENVVVTNESSRSVIGSSQMSTVSIPIQQIKSLPSFFGEVDILKAIQLMPGVQSGAEGTTGMYVRGGSPDQNLILLDGVPLYYVSHLGGLFSIFNADAISTVQLIKGGYPARYGGRLSSVLDIKMKEGNMKKFRGEGSLGFIAPKISLEGPIFKDKTSFIISARRTFADMILKPLSRSASDKKSSFGYHFYDVNAKINHIISNRDRLYLSFYAGQDKYASNIRNEYYKTDTTVNEKLDTLVKNFTNIKVSWGSMLGSLRWNHVFNDKLFSNFSLNFTNYRLELGAFQRSAQSVDTSFRKELRTVFRTRSGIKDISIKADFDFFPLPAHSIRYGGTIIHHTFTPGITSFKEEQVNDAFDTTLASFNTKAWEGYLYVEDDWEVTSKLKINAGAHYSSFYVNSKSYHSLQPRLSARYLLRNNFSIKASYSNMQQFVHLLTNSNAGLPTDLWVPATDRIRPQRSSQIAAGIFKMLKNNTYEFSVEGYYKKLDDLIEYKEGTNFFTFSDNWEDNVETGGKGTTMGIEFLIQRKTGRLTGWAGYTLAKNTRQFTNINFGNIFPYKYDRRHDISLVGMYKISKKVSFSSNWVYGTGNAVTLPSVQYHLHTENPNFNARRTLHVYNGRNSFRMRSYHRLDFNFSFHKEKKWGERTWNIGAYNLYSRKNPYLYFIDGNPFVNRTVKQVSLFPIIPYFSYHFKF